MNKNYLKAITLWENRRKGINLSPEEVIFVSQYTTIPEDKWESKIWHEALDRIPAPERELYISMLRRGEKLTVAPRINISTIHGVKGGEADHVAILTDSTMRMYEAMQIDPDAEHRVWYVGVTRAKKSLHIIQPQTRIAYEI